MRLVTALAVAAALTFATPVAAHHRDSHVRGPKAVPTVTPTPTAVPTPTPFGRTVLYSGSQAGFVTLTRDMSVDVIDLTGHTFGWEKVLIDVDRRARPLTIRGGTFTGPGRTSEGIFFLGLNSYTADVTLVGQTYDGVTLASSGAIEIRSGERLTIRDQTFRGLRRDSSYAPQPYHAWGVYISGANRVIRDLVLDGLTLERPPVNRDLSAIQIDSSNLSHGAVSIRNVTMTGYAYAFYENVTTNPLTLDTWSVTDTGWNGTAISFHKATGTYSDISLVSSGGIARNSSGMVAR